MSATTLVMTVLSLAALALVMSSTTRATDAAVTRFARKVDLEVADTLRADLRRSFRTRNLATGGGAITAVGAIWTTSVVTGSPDLDGDFAIWWVFFSGLLGIACGAGAVAVHEATRPYDSEAPRLARTVVPTLEDYVPAFERRGAWAVAGLPVVVLAVCAVGAAMGVLDAGALWTSGAPVLAIVCPFAVGLTELVSRRLLDRPQAAGTTLELAWSDASRARTLRDIVTVPLSLGLFATFGVTILAQDTIVIPGASQLTDAVLGLAFIGAVGSIVIIAIVGIAARPERHFRERLWPRRGPSVGAEDVAAITGGAGR